MRIGKVVREEGSGVMVRFERPAACTGCGGCARDQKTKTVFALGAARVGDIVSIQMPEGTAKRPVWLNYLALALGFVLGLLAGYLIRPAELVMVLGGAVGLAAGGAVIRVIDRRLGNKTKGQAQVLLVNDPQVMAAFEKRSACPKATGWNG